MLAHILILLALTSPLTHGQSSARRHNSRGFGQVNTNRGNSGKSLDVESGAAGSGGGGITRRLVSRRIVGPGGGGGSVSGDIAAKKEPPDGTKRRYVKRIKNGPHRVRKKHILRSPIADGNIPSTEHIQSVSTERVQHVSAGNDVHQQSVEQSMNYFSASPVQYNNNVNTNQYSTGRVQQKTNSYVQPVPSHEQSNVQTFSVQQHHTVAGYNHEQSVPVPVQPSAMSHVQQNVQTSHVSHNQQNVHPSITSHIQHNVQPPVVNRVQQKFQPSIGSQFQPNIQQQSPNNIQYPPSLAYEQHQNTMTPIVPQTMVKTLQQVQQTVPQPTLDVQPSIQHQPVNGPVHKIANDNVPQNVSIPEHVSTSNSTDEQPARKSVIQILDETGLTVSQLETLSPEHIELLLSGKATYDREAKFFSVNSDGLPDGVQVGEFSLGENRLLYTYLNTTGMQTAASVMAGGFIFVGLGVALFNYLSGDDGAATTTNEYNFFNKNDEKPTNEVTYQWGGWDAFDVVTRKKR